MLFTLLVMFLDVAGGLLIPTITADMINAGINGENMDYLHPTGQLASQNTGRSGTIPRPCLSTGCEMLSAQIPFDILPKEPTLEQYSRLSHDPDIIYRPDSVQFYLSQPSSMPEETTFREAVQAEKSPLTRAVPGYDAENAFLMLFEAAFSESLCRSPGSGTRTCAKTHGIL